MKNALSGNLGAQIRFIAMMKNQKDMLEVAVYEAPQVEVIEVAVEKGFATSGDIQSLSEEEW